jgi:hypothetical protein
MLLSNSANAPSIWSIIRSAAVVVSIASVRLRNPAFASKPPTRRLVLTDRARGEVQVDPTDHRKRFPRKCVYTPLLLES